MASSRSVSARPLASTERRYRRSAFNGAKQLSAAQAPTRRVLVLLGLLALALVMALVVIVGVHVQHADEPLGQAATFTHPASH